jgi:hypothetical protein
VSGRVEALSARSGQFLNTLHEGRTRTPSTIKSSALDGAARSRRCGNGVHVKAPTLILPTSVRRQPTSHEIDVFVPPEALFPHLEQSEATMATLLGKLGRDAVLLACARLNMVVNGTGNPDLKPRQARVSRLLCDPEDLSRINAFAATRPGGHVPVVFFRG